jgi:hypothetical protein
VHADSLPYGLESLGFPFPALALLAGRLPLGGGREVALMVGRLAGALSGTYALSASERGVRATAAKVWLASLALPANTRVPFARCIESTTGSPIQVAAALRAMIAAAGAHLDSASVGELERLARHLGSAP